MNGVSLSYGLAGFVFLAQAVDSLATKDWIQGGFAVFCAVLTGFLFWMTKGMKGVIEANTAAMTTFGIIQADMKSDLTKVKEDLYQRPCLSGKQNKAH